MILNICSLGDDLFESHFSKDSEIYAALVKHSVSLLMGSTFIS